MFLLRLFNDIDLKQETIEKVDSEYITTSKIFAENIRQCRLVKLTLLRRVAMRSIRCGLLLPL